MVGDVIGQAGFDATHAFFLIDQAQHTIIGIIELRDIRGVFVRGDTGLPLVPVATPAQLVTVDLQGLGIEVLDIVFAVHVTQEALDIR